MKVTGWIGVGLAAGALVVGLAAGPACAQDLTVRHVHAEQRPGENLVDVTYDLTTINGMSVAVRLFLSTDGGLSFPTQCLVVSGDIGDAVIPGLDRHIVWDVGAEFPQLDSADCRLRVVADDGIGPDIPKTVVFTTQDPEHILFPANASHLDSLHVLGLIDAVASADTVFRLGTGFDIPDFAYGEIDHVARNGYKDPSGNAVGIVSDGSEIRNSARYLNLRFSEPHRRAELVYIPWERCLPANATIKSAIMNVSLNSNCYFAFRDTIVAVQMANPQDDQWYRAKGIDSRYPDFAHACWDKQQTTNGGAWPGVDAYPWQPPLDERMYLWDWGEINDWTGTANPTSPGVLPIRTGVPIKLTNCVQSVVSGGVNHGVILCYADSYADVDQFKHVSWDDYGQTIGRTPYVVVTYTTQFYDKPFVTSDWAFMVSTDDGKFPCNNAYTDTFLAHGGRFTIFVAKCQVGSGYGASTPEQIIGFRQRGMGVGNHSRYHHNPEGLTYWTRRMAMTDTLSAAWDSLMFDASPAWMYAMADTIAGDLRDDPYYAKSFALPDHEWSPEVLLALEKLGYRAIRCGSTFGLYDRDSYFQVATQRPGQTDTLRIGVPTQWGSRPRNVIGMPPSDAVSYIVGLKANPAETPAELDSIRVNVHRAIFQVRGQDRHVLHLFWHDFKTNPSGPDYYNGVNGNELGAMLDVVDQLDGRYMGLDEYSRWLRNRATPVGTPAAYAQPDTYKVQDTDLIWYTEQP